MSILNVNQIQPVGSGQTVTINATNIDTGSATVTAGTFTASTNGSERVRITSDGKVSIGGFNPAVSGLSISNSSTNRGFEFDTASGFDSTSCIRAYDRPTTAYKSLGLTGSDIKFGINDVEKAAITSGGNVEIANGNLVFSTAGTGIDFSATANGSGTTTSELLDDYEEGTWTPVYKNGGTATYSAQVGRYTKIGDNVTAWFHLQLGSVGTASGSVIIQGLPFASINVSAFYGMCGGIHGNAWSAARAGLNILIQPNVSETLGIYYNTGSSSMPLISHTDLGTGNLLSVLHYKTS